MESNLGVPKCKTCGNDSTVTNDQTGEIVCDVCGTVIEDNVLSQEVEFAKDVERDEHRLEGHNLNMSRLDGFSSNRFFASERPAFLRDKSESTANRYRRERTNCRSQCEQLCQSLGIAQKYYNSIFQKIEKVAEEKFTKQKWMRATIATCVYIECREKQLPLTLLDVSEKSGISVFKLGKSYKNLKQLLNVHPQAIDPVVLVAKNTQKLTKFFPDESERQGITIDAIKIIKKSALDALVMGRRPEAIVGASLKLAAEVRGKQVSFLEVVRLVGGGVQAVRDRYREMRDMLVSLAKELPFVDIESFQKLKNKKKFASGLAGVTTRVANFQAEEEEEEEEEKPEPGNEEIPVKREDFEEDFQEDENSSPSKANSAQITKQIPKKIPKPAPQASSASQKRAKTALLTDLLPRDHLKFVLCYIDVLHDLRGVDVPEIPKFDAKYRENEDGVIEILDDDDDENEEDEEDDNEEEEEEDEIGIVPVKSEESPKIQEILQTIPLNLENPASLSFQVLKNLPDSISIQVLKNESDSGNNPQETQNLEKSKEFSDEDPKKKQILRKRKRENDEEDSKEEEEEENEDEDEEDEEDFDMENFANIDDDDENDLEIQEIKEETEKKAKKTSKKASSSKKKKAPSSKKTKITKKRKKTDNSGPEIDNIMEEVDGVKIFNKLVARIQKKKAEKLKQQQENPSASSATDKYDSNQKQRMKLPPSYLKNEALLKERRSKIERAKKRIENLTNISSNPDIFNQKSFEEQLDDEDLSIESLLMQGVTEKNLEDCTDLSKIVVPADKAVDNTKDDENVLEDENNNLMTAEEMNLYVKSKDEMDAHQFAEQFGFLGPNFENFE